VKRTTRTTRVATLPSLLALAAVLAGCGSTIEGQAVPEGAGAGGASAEFTRLLTECDAVTDEQIAEAVGVEAIERGFFGAICRWDTAGAGATAKVTFNWFETGSLDTERGTAQRLGYAVENTTVEGRRAVLMRPPDDPASCGISAGASTTGIFGWWVQYAPGSAPPDPCAAAVTLARLTLDLSS